MGINAVLRKDHREELASVPDDGMILARASTSGVFSETHLLRYLVPWGDAVFNQSQASDLHDDIRAVVDRNPGSPLSRHLLEIQPLVERLTLGADHYLWFLGD